MDVLISILVVPVEASILSEAVAVAILSFLLNSKIDLNKIKPSSKSFKK